VTAEVAGLGSARIDAGRSSLLNLLNLPAPADLPQESAVVVEVPVAEALIRRYRDRLDASAPWGVPAHVTVLYPFAPPGLITGEQLGTLAAAVASVPAFDCALRRTAWFGTEVLWLAPVPDGPFRALSRAVHAAFPQYPPYGGSYDDPVPHVTVGHTPPATLEQLREAEPSVQHGLPLQIRVSHASLITGSQAAGSWRSIARLPLG